ncbi:hypothetical protein AF332_14895 [Sporosarcina globispora]|uniref:ABC transporter domain-containing protein n=1 Tax=Sporosarcina globispora TaxID=1459 RepID=A0A0M0GDR8_SPOGL|nr:dipeptide ABC transporter ATP-binding protein [Sporosarcina globispora]KON87984.1 hypothetical protein AF332_14895 [Sporosarcina globispora]
MESLLKLTGVEKNFHINRGLFKRNNKVLKAVDGVEFNIEKGETFGLVGESGCGKSTLGKLIVKLLNPSSGNIYFNGRDITKISKKEHLQYTRDIQMIFQDPFSSFNPRQKVIDILMEPLDIHFKSLSIDKKRKVVEELLERVGLTANQANRYPHQFSGGQRQRIGIARALSLNPKLIVCDEPVSALDVSIQSQIINLLKDIQKDLGISYLFIAHNLGVVKHISDRIGVMYLGNIVETASKEDLFENPLHPYTKALISSVPKEHPDEKKERIVLRGEIPSPSEPPVGCKFHTRCPLAQEICRKEVPVLEMKIENHRVACHLI